MASKAAPTSSLGECFLDSAATNHFANDVRDLTETKPISTNVTLGDCTEVPIKRQGIANIKGIRLSSLFVPSFRISLILTATLDKGLYRVDNHTSRRTAAMSTVPGTNPVGDSTAKPTPVRCDNHGALVLINSGVVRARTRYIEVKFHHVQSEQKEKKTVPFEYVPRHTELAERIGLGRPQY